MDKFEAKEYNPEPMNELLSDFGENPDSDNKTENFNIPSQSVLRADAKRSFFEEDLIYSDSIGIHELYDIRFLDGVGSEIALRINNVNDMLIYAELNPDILSDDYFDTGFTTKVLQLRKRYSEAERLARINGVTQEEVFDGGLYFEMMINAYTPMEYVAELTYPVVDGKYMLLDLMDHGASSEEILEFLNKISEGFDKPESKTGFIINNPDEARIELKKTILNEEAHLRKLSLSGIERYWGKDVADVYLRYFENN